MLFEIGFWGVALKIKKLELRLFHNDLYIHIPGYLSIAWNRIGFFIDKDHTTREWQDD